MLRHTRMDTPFTMGCVRLVAGVAVVLAASTLAGCAQQRKADVWEQYDIRVPVPATSRVPNVLSNQPQYNPYNYHYGSVPLDPAGYPVDNDVYYMPPINDINSETYD